jgi:hypothetical protein
MRKLNPVAPFASMLVSTLCGAAPAACIDSPPGPTAPSGAKIVVQWDPLACGTPHRIAVELEDEEGLPLSSSAPCALGGLSLGAPHYGVYTGRAYAWTAGQPIRSITPAWIVVDEPIVRWIVETPR